MAYIEWIGLIAAALTTFAFFPQVLKTYRTKSVEDISLGMYTIFLVGLIIWLIYGIIINNLPIICANVITITFAISIIFLKLKYGKSRF